MDLRIFSLLLALLPVSQCYEAEFFYSPVVNTCGISQDSIKADGNTARGGICAHMPETKRVYACPAPDERCWTWAQACEGDNGGSPSQTTCTRWGTTWCCPGFELCSSINSGICKSYFMSPNSGVNVSVANSAELLALNVTSVTATIQTADPTPYSTTTFTVTRNATSVTSSTAAAITSSAFTTAATPTPAATESSTPQPEPSKPAPGAVAGAVIGVIVALALIAAAVYFFWWRRRPSQDEFGAVNIDDMSDSRSLEKIPPVPINEKYGTERLELPGAMVHVYEMESANSSRDNWNHHRASELPA